VNEDRRRRGEEDADGWCILTLLVINAVILIVALHVLGIAPWS
jgi:hypothetical protein